MWYFIVSGILWIVSLAIWIAKDTDKGKEEEEDLGDKLLYGTIKLLSTLLLSLLWPLVILCFLVYGLARVVSNVGKGAIEYVINLVDTFRSWISKIEEKNSDGAYR